MSNIAIIPARGGSKRIPRKNIRDFLGKPIIAYSIKIALQSKLFDTVMVSTDDEEIAEIARKYGAEVPFMRSEKNADDKAGTVDVLLEVLTVYKKQNIEFDNLCCIYPAAPLLKTEILNKVYKILIDEKFDVVFPTVPFSYPIQRGLKIIKDKMKMVCPENLNTNSQDLEPIYHDAGQFYWMNTSMLFKKKSIFTDNCGSVILSEMEVQDIDNESDWKLAELKYKL